MGASATTVWEVRATGSDSNGGGFDPALGGTDYSQQDSPQATGTASSSGTTVTATTGIFTSAMVGNLITNGTGWFEITAFTSATIVTVDSAPSWTSQSVKIGGAIATPMLASVLAVTGNKVYFKSAGSTPDYVINSYTSSAHNASGAVLGWAGYVALEGYITSRGDGTRGCVTIQNGTNAAPWVIFNYFPAGAVAKYLTFDCNNKSNSQYATYSTGLAIDCVAKNFGASGFFTSSVRCYADNSGMGSRTGTGFGNGTHSSSVARYCSIGFQQYSASHCIAVDCVTGFLTGSYIHLHTYCFAYTCTGDGFQGADGGSYGSGAYRCTAHSCGGYGFNDNGNFPAWVGCFAYSNTSGSHGGITASVADITSLTADPCVNASGGNFSPNTTVGGGAAIRGLPIVLPGISTTIYLDAGGMQHQDAGGGGIILNSPMNGGLT